MLFQNRTGPSISDDDAGDYQGISNIDADGRTQLSESRLDRRLALGFWTHTGTFDRWAGGRKDGTSGGYLVYDQRLWRENWNDLEDEQGVTAFFQLGWADDVVAEVDLHLGGGATWLGPIPGRDDDALGVMASLVHISDKAQAVDEITEDFELAIETFYKIQITPWSSVKPDLQWIVNPGGDRSLGNAFVGTLRSHSDSCYLSPTLGVHHFNGRPVHPS